MENRVLVFILGVLLISCLLGINSVSAITIRCSPTIKLINQDPTPAIPDSYLKLIFEVSGIGTECEGLKVKLSPEYPFSLDPSSNPIQTIEGTPDTPDYKNTWMVPYKVRVANDALEGDYDLKLLYNTGTQNFDNAYVIDNFNISITDSQTDFSIVIQGTSGTQASIGIVNIGRNTANSLIVGIPAQENFIASGINEQIVGNLAAGDYTIVSFNIASVTTSVNARNQNRTNSGNFNRLNPGQNITNSSNARLNSQMLNIKLDYTDGIGKRRSVIKQVQFSGSSAQGNFTRTSTRSSSGTISGVPYTYIIIIILIIIIVIIIYKGYHKKIFEKMKHFYEKNKSHHEKNSQNTPDWVLAERTHNKK